MYHDVTWRALLAAPILAALMLAAGAGAIARDAAAAGEKLDLWRPGDAGQRLLIRGRVSSAQGKPIAGATILIRQADGTGVYTAQYSGSLQSGADGSYGFGTVLPGQYSSTKHIHMVVQHADYSTRHTEILFKGDANNASAAHDPNAIVTEEATIGGETVLLGEFNIVMAP